MKGEAAMKKQTTMRGMKKKDVMEFVCNVKTAGVGHKHYVGILSYFTNLF